MQRPPIVAIIGRKHAGKTTLTVRLAAEHHRGRRVMTIKHGAHTVNIDQSTTDTYRHFHEGHAERVAMVAPDKFGLVMRWSDEISPEAIAAKNMSDTPTSSSAKASSNRRSRRSNFIGGGASRSAAGSEAVDATTYRAFVTDGERRDDIAPRHPARRRWLVAPARRLSWKPRSCRSPNTSN